MEYWPYLVSHGSDVTITDWHSPMELDTLNTPCSQLFAFVFLEYLSQEQPIRISGFLIHRLFLHYM